MQQPPAPPNRRRQVYFEPGVVRLLVEHPAGYSLSEVVAAVQGKSYLSSLLDQSQPDLEHIVSFVHSQRIARMPVSRRPRREAFSVVPYRLQPLRYHSARQLIRLLEELNKNILSIHDEAPVILRIAAPNWLSAPTPENIGGGGPGARPVPAMLEPQFFGSQADTPGAPYSFRLASLPNFEPRATTRDVDVAILDTAYSAEQLADAYNTYQATHPVIRSLLEPDGTGGFMRLRVTPAMQLGISLPGPQDLRVERHDYPMNDHGLFIAGIIHSIAPNAKIELIQVLNEYGVGTTQGIDLALQQLYQRQAQIPLAERRPLVVNCSFMLVMPLPGHYKDNGNNSDDLIDWEIFKQHEDLLTPDDWYLLDQYCLDLDWVCDALRANDVLVIAAAGNDANNGLDVYGTDRPRARFPAAFTSVEGISALEQGSMNLATYSNKPDRPAYRGIAVFGGNATTTLDMAGNIADSKTIAGEGVLGAYIGGFPKDKPAGHEHHDDPYETEAGTTGWAWWAGTSFAAPMVSGAAAALLGHGLPPTVAIAAIRAAQIDLTEDNAEVFSIVQG